MQITEYSSNYARDVVPSTGVLDYNNKNNSYAVRAFHEIMANRRRFCASRS